MSESSPSPRRARGEGPGGRFIGRLFGEVQEGAVEVLSTVLFFGCVVAWILGAVLAGVFFGPLAFLFVFLAALIPLIWLFVRAGRRHYAEQRRRGHPDGARRDLREAVVLWLVILGVGALIALLLFLVVGLLERM